MKYYLIINNRIFEDYDNKIYISTLELIDLNIKRRYWMIPSNGDTCFNDSYIDFYHSVFEYYKNSFIIPLNEEKFNELFSIKYEKTTYNEFLIKYGLDEWII